ncbi:MAG: response regulator [Euryarchaeota archaeon]|nr:response regulator [Euryarchaeota archaeon]
MRCPDILVIDDNQGDALIIKEAFEDSGSCVSLSFASDGVEALTILRNVAALPDLIVLDIKMPKMDGLDFLKVLRNDPDLNAATVVILTSSDDPRDREMARYLGVINYFTKPSRFNNWITLSRKLKKLSIKKQT